MKVEEGMSAQVLTIGPAHTLREAAKMMAVRRVGAAVVVNPDNAGVGILTERDILMSVAAGQSPGYCLGGWRKWSEHRVLLREIVYPAGEAANRSLAGKPVQGDPDRFAAAEVQEVSRNEHRTTSTTMNGCK